MEWTSVEWLQRSLWQMGGTPLLMTPSWDLAHFRAHFLRIFAWPRKHLRACAKVAKKNGRKMGAKMGGEMGGGDARNGRKNGRTKNGRTSWGWMLFVNMTIKRNPKFSFRITFLDTLWIQ